MSTLAPAPLAPETARPAAEARGFVLYVGLDEAKAAADGTTLAAVVDQVKQLLDQVAPSAATHAAVALAPVGVGGRDLDVVRVALKDPSAPTRATAEPAATPRRRTGVTIDLSRKRISLDGDVAPLTYKEFELLQFLVLREGITVERAVIVDTLWANSDDAPNERTIDVHVRRLRAKLGDYQDIVRTVRGVGYRFDRHADVTLRYGTGPSPDRF